ncbi:hypothetical protein OF83DRAFT_1128265, partial [Amylostereum chailletii]
SVKAGALGSRRGNTRTTRGWLHARDKSSSQPKSAFQAFPTRLSSHSLPSSASAPMLKTSVIEPLPPPAKAPAEPEPDHSLYGRLGCHPSDEFWLEDGSIILVCATVGFRVHRSVLAMHSEVFRDMFTVGRKDDQGEMFDGCLVLRLQDAAEDIKYLLRALYYREFAQDKRALSLFVLAAVLRMATKYIIQSLRRELVAYVLVLFPSSRAGCRTLLRNPDIVPVDFNPLLGVEIALTCDLPILLPVACYGAARMELKAVYDGFRLGDGRWVRVGPETARTCVYFREALGRLVERSVHEEPLKAGWYSDSGGLVGAHDKCPGIGAGMMREMEARYRTLRCDVVCGSLPYGAQEGSSILVKGVDQLCEGCLGRMDRWEKEVQGLIWKGLPAACGWKGGWDVLRASSPE